MLSPRYPALEGFLLSPRYPDNRNKGVQHGSPDTHRHDGGSAKPKAERYTIADPQLPGHYVRVSRAAPRPLPSSRATRAASKCWQTIGSAALYTIAEAREKAREAIKAIKAGEDRAGPQSFAGVAEQWFKRHVEAKGTALGGRDSPLSRQVDFASMGRSRLHLDPAR